MAALLGVLPGTEAGRGDVGNSYSVANLLFGWIGSGAGGFCWEVLELLNLRQP